MCAFCGADILHKSRNAKYCGEGRCQLVGKKEPRVCLHCGAVCRGAFCSGGKCLKRFQRNFLRGYRAYGCFLCDEQTGIDLHHVKPSEKTDKVAMMCGHYSLLRIVQELEKCLPLCEKHHNEAHKHYKSASHGIITTTFPSGDVLVQMLLTEPVMVGGYRGLKKAA
jgi:hypothetical protein